MDTGEIDVYGVSSGEPTALQLLAVRRGASVLAYCNQLCGPADGPAAAAETFARARAILRDDENLAAIDPDQVLRRATRHTAAGAARSPQGPPPTGEIVGRATETCLDVAIALAAASDQRLDEEQRSRLRLHIDSCSRCAALAEITRRADASYSDPVNDRVGSDHAERFAAAMATVPNTGPGAAPPPTGEIGAKPCSVFPRLPDLGAEVAIGAPPAPSSEDAPIQIAAKRRGRIGRVLHARRAGREEVDRLAA